MCKSFSKTSKRIKFIIVIPLIILLCAVFFTIKKSIQIEQQTSLLSEEDKPFPTKGFSSVILPTPAETVIDPEILTLNGVLKKPIKGQQKSGICEHVRKITSTSLSPDKNYVCFTAVCGFADNMLYFVDINGEGLLELAIGSNCSWSPDSKIIAYTKKHAEAATPMIAYYSLIIGKETEPQIVTDDMFTWRAFDKPIWAADGRYFVTKWTRRVDRYNINSQIIQGSSKVDTLTGTIVDL